MDVSGDLALAVEGGQPVLDHAREAHEGVQLEERLGRQRFGRRPHDA
jgi:hypothetical protein